MFYEWNKPLKLVINVSFSLALNKQYPYNKRWQKVCFILISVRHEAKKEEKRTFFSWIVLKSSSFKFETRSLLKCKNLLRATTQREIKAASISILLHSLNKPEGEKLQGRKKNHFHHKRNWNFDWKPKIFPYTSCK